MDGMYTVGSGASMCENERRGIVWRWEEVFSDDVEVFRMKFRGVPRCLEEIAKIEDLGELVDFLVMLDHEMTAVRQWTIATRGKVALIYPAGLDLERDES